MILSIGLNFFEMKNKNEIDGLQIIEVTSLLFFSIYKNYMKILKGGMVK